MIREYDIRRYGDAILVGIRLECAVLDFQTSDRLLQDCIDLLDRPHNGLVHMRIGMFGEFPVTLNMDHDESLSIFVDGPTFEPQRELCAAIWLSKEELRSVIHKALFSLEASQPPPN